MRITSIQPEPIPASITIELEGDEGQKLITLLYALRWRDVKDHIGSAEYDFVTHLTSAMEAETDLFEYGKWVATFKYDPSGTAFQS